MKKVGYGFCAFALLVLMFCPLLACANLGPKSGGIGQDSKTSVNNKSQTNLGEPSGGNMGANQQGQRNIQVITVNIGDAAVGQTDAVLRHVLPVTTQPGCLVNTGNDDSVVNTIYGAATQPAEKGK